jgi:PAS domain-containing protein
MILRLLRVSLLPEHVAVVVAALRTEAERARGWPGMIAATHGIRREGELIRGLALSAWTDYDSLLRVAEGRPDRDVSEVWRTGTLRDITAEHYELTDPIASATGLEAEVLGVIWGTIRPNVEGSVHDMIRSIRPTVSAAGAGTLFIGRRVVHGRTEIVVVAPWRDRLSLHEFAQSRTVGAIDPAFTAQLDQWRFETYDTVVTAASPDAASSEAVLIVDEEGRCVDTTTGVEALVGFPGELLLRRTLEEMVQPDARLAVARDWKAVAAAGRGQLDLRLAPWPGREIEVHATAVGGTPRADLHSLTLTNPRAIDGTPEPARPS